MSLEDSSIIARGQHFLEEEGRAILEKARALDGAFAELVRRLLSHDGRVVVTGVGKSGIIGEKISATLSSTGTPSFFLRPVEALHGDLGALAPGDLLVALSNSGETAEILALCHACARLEDIEIVAFTGNPESSLARLARWTIDTSVPREACPLDLAPTTSTTVTLAVGDALALVLLEARGFTAEHYARFHPGGSLGERLRYRVRDLQRSGDLLPTVGEDATLSTALDEMTRRDNVGLVFVTTGDRELAGVLTDGDLRRVLLTRGASEAVLATPVREVMTRRPRSIEVDASAKDALHLMEVHGITSLAVLDAGGRLTGLIHLHDILGRGKIVL